MLINFSVMATPFTSDYSAVGAVSWLIRPLLQVWANLSLYLHRPDDSTSPKQIEGHLPEKSIQNVFDNSGKPGAESIGVQMAYPEELLHDVTFF